MTNNNGQLNDAKFRISFSLAELKTLQHFLSLPSAEIDALDILPLVQKIQKAERKAAFGITLPAYTGKTSEPGLATISRMVNEEKNKRGAALLERVRSGAESHESALTEAETYEAMVYFIETLGKTPETDEEKEAMATYMHVKVFGASQA
jgi:hypothetical protein